MTESGVGLLAVGAALVTLAAIPKLWDGQSRVMRTTATSGPLPAISCFAEGAQQTVHTLRDSAGVTIIELKDVAVTHRQAWRPKPAPVLSIGQVEGPAPVRFFNIRGVLRLDEDGRIVVADGSNEVRFYDRAGAHLRSVGRDGEGPGEFRVISFFTRYGRDSLLVWDERLLRGTVLSQDGAVGRIFRGPAFQAGQYSFVGVFPDGVLLGAMVSGITVENARPGLNPVRATYFRFDPTNGLIDTIGKLFDGETYVSTRYGMRVMTMPFGFRAVSAVANNQLYYGSSKTYEIRTYTRGEKLARILRLRRPNRPLNQEVIDAFVERVTSRARDPDAQRRRALEYRNVPYHKTLPAYSALKLDGEGNVWVASYELPGKAVAHWTVFDRAGCLIGDVTMPPRFTAHQIGSDYLLGVARDRLDVERVVMLQLEKPQ